MGTANVFRAEQFDANGRVCNPYCVPGIFHICTTTVFICILAGNPGNLYFAVFHISSFSQTAWHITDFQEKKFFFDPYLLPVDDRPGWYKRIYWDDGVSCAVLCIAALCNSPKKDPRLSFCFNWCRNHCYCMHSGSAWQRRKNRAIHK